MKVTYLTYGTQSGVVHKLISELIQYNITCEYHDVATGLNYRYDEYKLPRLSVNSILNTYHSIAQFGSQWKDYFYRTDYYFNHMSEVAVRLICRNNCDILLQSGLLFSPYDTCDKPYVLGILDNTYLIGKLGRNRPPSSMKLSEKYIRNETDTYQRADIIFAMSNHVKQSLIEDYDVRPERVIVTGVGPNIEPDLNYIPSDTKYESHKIVMIAMEFYRKGGQEVIKAFKRVKKLIPSSNLVVIGEKLDLQIDGVTFMGLQDKTVIKKELSEANLYVMPSHIEPFGIALIEAMAFHTPCIASNIEAMPEIISDGVTGYLVDSYNVDELAYKIEGILNDPSLAKSMGSAGYNKYLKKYSWQIVGKTINSQLKSLLPNV